MPIIGIVAALILLATSGVAQAQTQPCTPPGGLQSSDLARKASEVTEYFAGGVYRVSRCDTAGAVVRSQTVAPILTPGGGYEPAPIGEYRDNSFTASTYPDPDDPVWAKAWPRERARVRDDVIPPTQRRPVPRPPDPGQRLGGAASCSNREYHFSGPRLYPGHGGGRYTYRARVRSMPKGARQAITKGHHTWDQTRNDCGLADVTSIVSTYGGTTSNSAHTYADGVNTVDFGDPTRIGCAATSVACTRWLWNGTFFTDIDQRYGGAYDWSTTGAKGRYDVWSVAAHESGHAVGLADASSSTWLTMYYQACQGCTKWRTLGAGDVLGLNARYRG